MKKITTLVFLLIILFSFGNASADGGGHKEILPDETIIGISLVSSIITYFFIAKISGHELSNQKRLISSLIVFTTIVHAILGTEDLKLLLGAVGFLGFGCFLYILKLPLIEENKTNFRYLLAAYTFAIIIFYIYLHPDLTKNGEYDILGLITKLSEIGIIGLVIKRDD